MVRPFCIFRTMFKQGLLLLAIGVLSGTDAHFSCAPDSILEHVTHTSVTTVTNRVTSYYITNVGTKDVTLTKTEISRVTSTTTVDQTLEQPINYATSTTYLTSTSFISAVYTVHVTSTTTLTTNVLLTTQAVTTSTSTHSIISGPTTPRLTTVTTTTVYATPTLTRTYVTQSTVPPLVSTVTSIVTVTSTTTVMNIPKPETVTTTTFQTVTFCDAPYTTIIS